MVICTTIRSAVPRMLEGKVTEGSLQDDKCKLEASSTYFEFEWWVPGTPPLCSLEDHN